MSRKFSLNKMEVLKHYEERLQNKEWEYNSLNGEYMNCIEQLREFNDNEYIQLQVLEAEVTQLKRFIKALKLMQ